MPPDKPKDSDLTCVGVAGKGREGPEGFLHASAPPRGVTTSSMPLPNDIK